MMLLLRVFLSRSDHSPLRLLLSLDRALVPMVSSGPCRHKTVIWIELTSPWEENLTKKHFEKMDKYNKLAIDYEKEIITG